MKHWCTRLIIRVIPILLVVSALYLLWLYRGEEALQNSVTNVYSAQSDLQGKEAPHFEILKSESWRGQQFSLKDRRGRPVLLHFWATWCGPCVQELPELIALARARQNDFQFIAVAIDRDWQTIGDFFNRYPELKSLPDLVELLLDPKGKVPALYGSNGLPESFLLDDKLTVKAKLMGQQPWGSKPMRALLDSLRSQK
jgi:thiol-disulfide isomerase/thioredoxin